MPAPLPRPSAATTLELRFRDAGSRQLFLVAVATLLGNDEELIFGMRPVDGGTLLVANRIDVRIKKVPDEE